MENYIKRMFDGLLSRTTLEILDDITRICFVYQCMHAYNFLLMSRQAPSRRLSAPYRCPYLNPCYNTHVGPVLLGGSKNKLPPIFVETSKLAIT